jgi:topoisomerase-4 subunit A
MLVEEESMVAEKRSGRQVLNLKEGEFAKTCSPAEGNQVAVLGDNRRFLIFPADQLPVMARGLGVALQKYADGGLKQAIVFSAEEGLLWPGAVRVRQFADLQEWVGRRAAVGKSAPAWALKKA